jgi:4'-phosphopantetheinyl transferase
MRGLLVESPEGVWRNAPAEITLSPTEVHVWRADLDMPAESIRRFEETLSPDELARASRFYFPRGRCHYIAGRGVLRSLLAGYLGIGVSRVHFRYNAHGKPALAPNSAPLDVRFNVSHSGGLALFAFGLGREIGLDLEPVSLSRIDESLAQRYFLPQELAALYSLPKAAQAEGFFRCWTRQEAYLKALGVGFDHGFPGFVFSTAPLSSAKLLIKPEARCEAGKWSICDLAPGPGFVAALAAEAAGWSVELWTRA